MLLHKRRIEGNLSGAGYINPCSNDRLSPVYLQPMCYNDYANNLILIQEDYKEEKEIQIKDNYKEMAKEEQSGSGVAETAAAISALYQTIKTAGTIASKAYSSEVGTKVKNIYGKHINPHPNWRPGFVGEKHMLHSSGNTYNYLGPGTHVEERLQRGDPPLDGSYGLDAQAKIHDIDYVNAKTLSDVRQADKKFIKNIEKSDAGKVSKKVITSAIKGKMLAEDLGLLDKNYFSQINIASNEDTNLVGKGANLKDIMRPAKKQLKKVRKMGKYPDSYLRNKLIKQYGRQRLALAELRSAHGKSKNKLINKINA